MTTKRTTGLLVLASCLLLAACSSTEKVGCPAGQVQDAITGGCLVPAATCTPGAPGTLVDTCAAEHRQCYEDSRGAMCGLCQDGYRDAAGTCTAVTTCTQLDCASQNRTCSEAGAHSDAVCGTCVDGAIATTDGRCVTPSCDPSVAGSTAQSCQTQHRACMMNAAGPACGGCVSGYVDDLGTCRPVKTCVDLGCAAANRLCTPPGANSDATCGACLAGYLDQGGTCGVQSNATCDPAPASGSIAAGCASENRTCVAGTPASCGGCVSGDVMDPSTQLCIPQQGCAQLDCASQHRDCSDTPFGHCTTCQSGYVQDTQTGQCRAPIPCAQLTCAAGSTCVEATATADAYCQTSCPSGQVWNGSTCQSCPVCNGTGEAGVWSSTTQNGYCICQTQPGYFYSVGADVGTYPCDHDGDGWVRESARGSINSTDPAIKANARCDLRTITAFSLVNEAGQAKDFPLSVPLPLYESDRNDDDQILQSVMRQRGIPQYGPDRDISAAELNRLTKLCFSPKADYNDNGVADTEEYADHPLAPAFRPDQAPFNQYSYFAELNYGYFQPAAAGALTGKYVIAEKTRLDDPAIAAPDKEPVGYEPTDGAYWRSCEVRRDSAWNTQNPPIGMDFAKSDDPSDVSWRGMNHHSQFKCVEIENQPDPTIPSQLTAAQAGAQALRLNACVASGAATANPGNPSKTTDRCTLVSATSAQPGDVFWAAEPYIDYDRYGMYPSVPDGSYVRGCINECSEYAPDRCSTWGQNPSDPSAGVDCSYDPANFGKFSACTGHETCDGYDNDGDGVVDNGDPGGGQSCQNDGAQFPANSPACSTDAQCDTANSYYCNQNTGHCGLAGVCTAGTTHCVSGKIVCQPNVLPGTQAEVCDGKDNNCNNQVDENNPGGGVQSCPVPGKLGACASGKLSCQNGSLSLCVQTVFPAPYETCGNAVDEDCDGNLDNAPTDGTCSASYGFNTYYVDADGDGYGNKSQAVGTCLCPSKATGQVTDHRDCCDSDNGSHPNATTPKTYANACGSYDWDCDGNITKLSDTSVTAGCGYRAVSCGSASVGWADSVPSCGETHTWYIDDCGDWAPCPQHSTQVTQTCY